MSDSLEQYQGEDFATYIARERERLIESRKEVLERVDAADRDLAKIDLEFVAIDAYERAKTSKAPALTATRQPRQQRRDVTEQVMNALLEAPDGLRRARIIEALGVKGDKPGEMSVSNALTRLQKAGRITRREDQHWMLLGPLQQAAE